MSGYAELFELTEEHIKLLESAYWDYHDDYEYGSIGTDFKRPFGNSSVTMDIAEILGWTIHGLDEDDDEYWERVQEEYYDKAFQLYKGLATALRIILQLNTFETGLYGNNERYGIGDWVFLGE